MTQTEAVVALVQLENSDRYHCCNTLFDECNCLVMALYNCLTVAHIGPYWLTLCTQFSCMFK